MYKPMIGAAEKDIAVIDSLKRCVEDKLGWGPGNEWTQQQCEELCDRINAETKILLSTNTVKRFFGKIQSNSLPGKTTLNTFARFCGYDSFYDFAERNSENLNSQHISPKKRGGFMHHQTVKLAAIVTLFAVVIAATVYIFVHYQKEKLIGQMRFSQTWNEGFVPFTQIFKYQVSPAFSDTIQFNEYFKGNIALSTRDSVFSWMHFVPGFRKVRFTAGKQVLWENSYLVKTRGWLFIFPWGGSEPRKYISLDSCKNYLTVSDELLTKNKIDLEQDGGWAHYFNARDFHAEGSSFKLTTTFRNPLKTGTQQCQDAIVSIECETFEFRIHFTQTGCQKFAEISMGNDYYGGIQNDMTSLTFEMDQWQTISIKSKNGILTVANAGKTIFEKAYSGKPGKITGLRFSFRGNGQIENLALSNADDERVYSDDFE